MMADCEGRREPAEIKVRIFLNGKLKGEFAIMDDTSKLTQAVSDITVDVGLLIAMKTTPPPPPSSVQPAIDAATAALKAADATVKAALNVAPPSPAPGVPVISGVAPSSIAAGQTATVTLTGSGFAAATGLGGSDGLTFDSIVIVSDTEITVNVTVAPGTAAGSQQISVTNAAGASNLAPLTTT